MAHKEAANLANKLESGEPFYERFPQSAGMIKSSPGKPTGAIDKGTATTVGICERKQSSNSSTSSMLTNSSASPSSSLTSISASSPTSSSNTNFSNYATISSVSSNCQQSVDPILLVQNDCSQTIVGHCCSQTDSQEVGSVGEMPEVSKDDARIVERDEATQPLASQQDSPNGAPSKCGARLERSNSCSQAETTSCGLLLQESATLADLACVVSSASQDNLARPTAALVTVLNPNLERNSTGHLAASSQPTESSQESSQLQPKQQQPSSSRFFSSKLNTGSLWSLLSAGSTSGSQNLAADGVEGQSQKDSSSGAVPVEDNSKQQDNSLGGFFSRVQFPSRSRQPAIATKTTSQQVDSLAMPPPPPALTTSKQETLVSQTNLKRARFNVKYIGSALLHKNFTLPMLEWIARDIKRQTTKGAQSTSHRQFAMPKRDIVLEIQPFQLKGISCKDRHCIFVHPMHCVSKYAQLQHDQTCFSYLIRDNKDSPYFCHVFQAKSTSKVHDIFSAIREATTTRTVGSHNRSLTCETPSGQQSPASDPSSSHEQPVSAASNSLLKPTVQETKNMMGILNNGDQQDHQLNKSIGFNQTSQADPTRGVQFENSYQFEVMFVKKVKLQCRRVPASFVDDALETLKSFEVLKGGDTKGQIKSIGKRIISASVDERQEYDQDHCQPPTPTSQGSGIKASLDEERRGSSASLHKTDDNKQSLGGGGGGGDDERESRSCQQSPTKGANFEVDRDACWPRSEGDKDSGKKKHQSMDCLKNIDCTIQSAKNGNAPTYANDFSPYNTITCSDLNERIAKIPVVSSSVSLDHETRQKLAKQVRETIMATAANIKKDVYASGDKLDSSSSSKALDSLSCTATSSVPLIDEDQLVNTSHIECQQSSDSDRAFEHRRSSAAAGSLQSSQQPIPSSGNNFDLFRRASGRQVVKNRTMLLLIGKDELCTISIDKHQMLFSKSFSLIVHCLQGHNNKDHFGLICRDSGKINPQAESYAGFIFKCQSDKVVREIMGALKQVIYSSHHNYHGYNSPYNPLNSSALVATNQYQTASKAQHGQLSPKLNRQSQQQLASVTGQHQEAQPQPQTSLAAKRGFINNNIEINEAARLCRSTFGQQQSTETPATGGKASASIGPSQAMKFNQQPAKNLIKSMFCDQCPLYWYHRLCCDIESLPADACKAIILRRIDSSLSELEQDELYSRFSEFTIDSIDEHNEIFMSLLRQLCERKQLKHNQNLAHQSALAKNSSSVKQQSTNMMTITGRQSSGQRNASDLSSLSSARHCEAGHQRSGSSGGLLPFGIGQTSVANNQSIADASSVAIDNLKKAKNSISVSIENMLKRRSSMRDEQQGQEDSGSQSTILFRSGSFRSNSRETHNGQSQQAGSDSPQLKRSQSTCDQAESNYSWRDSLSKTLNNDLATPLATLFRRRSSTFGSNENNTSHHVEDNVRASTECLSQHNNGGSSNGSCLHSPARQPASPSILESRFMLAGQTGRASPSSVLSSSFWKKSIFDKIKQPIEETTSKVNETETEAGVGPPVTSLAAREERPKRSRAELRLLWKKAILEQITLLKMDKQNQRLQENTAEHDIQRLKLNYKDVPYGREAAFQWSRLLNQDPRKKVEFVEVARLVRSGVPKQRRGEIWMFLMNQYQLRHGTSFQPADNEFQGDANQTYRDLLSQLSVQQHEIFVDIGRTFPTHPYYSQYLSLGQLSLFNLLKAYSLLDQEVGYCQGLSFVAGILLLHVDGEDEAFELMRHLLFNFGLRKQYLPSMNALHLQLYQITRLLRDHEYDLFNHFDHYDISPSLYAAPWFLTLFASQFPLGFVARLLDLVFLIGIEAIFRVSLKLLAYHRANIIDCKSLESSMEYIRFNLVKIDDKNLAKIFDESMSLDLRNKLIEYEIEYTFYCAEDKARTNNPPSSNHYTSVTKLKTGPSQNPDSLAEANTESTSVVADATATVIIQHLLANNHLKSLRSNYSY